MVTQEEFSALLQEEMDVLPDELFRELNGGVIVSPRVHLHPKNVADDLFILGEYQLHWGTGRRVVLYYGSFVRVYAGGSDETLRAALRRTLRHELRHHWESLSGEHALEDDDACRLLEYEKEHPFEP